MRAALMQTRGLLLLALLLSTLALLAGCAARAPRALIELPPLRLAPAALQGTLALQQRLSFAFGTQTRELDALLEADADAVRLAVQALGRSGVTLVWDGRTLQQTRADWLPAAVRGERVLDDLQFVYWPLASIRAVLPPGWTLDETPSGQRSLRHGGEVWLQVNPRAADTVELDNRAEGYRLTVRSVPLSFVSVDEQCGITRMQPLQVRTHNLGHCNA